MDMRTWTLTRTTYDVGYDNTTILEKLRQGIIGYDN